MTVVSKHNPLDQYQWGNQCDGWVLSAKPELSVKLERMPPNSAEQKHFHRHATQFFFILKGQAAFEIDERVVIIHCNEGILVEPGRKHRIINQSDNDLEFLLSSQPAVQDDRVDC